MSARENRENCECKKCGQKFTLFSNYRRHVLHNKVCGIRKEGFKCTNCNKEFSLNATLKDHYERCIAEDPHRFNCPYCPKLFTFKSSLNKHLRGRCRNAKNNITVKMHSCNYCSVEFFSYGAWRKHLSEGSCMVENHVQRYICPHCANAFTLKSSLNKHLKGRCKSMKQNPDGESQKFEVIIDVSEDNEYENVTAYEIIPNDDVIEECPEWDTYEAENVESYIEIANDDDEEKYEFIKIQPISDL